MNDKQIRDHIARARRGEPVTKALIADLRDLERARDRTTFRETFALQRVIRLALFGSNDKVAVRTAIQDTLGITHGRLALKGLLFRDDDPIELPFPTNPWGIDRALGVEAAIAQVWRGLREASGLARELGRRAVGLAYFEAKAKEPVLGYVLYRERDDYQVPEAKRAAPRPPFRRAAALDWEPFGDLALTFGCAPMRTLPRGKVVVPDALRRLYAVHGGMFGSLWRLHPPRDLSSWSEMVGPGHDHLVGVFSYGDDRSDLLDVSKRAAAPPVLAWGEGHLYSKKGPPFWKWFAEQTPLFCGHANV